MLHFLFEAVRAKQFIPATVKLASLEITYGQSGETQLLAQMMQSWKELYRIKMGQLVGGCTPEYTVWKGQKIEDIVLPPARMRVSIPDHIPKQPSEVDIVWLEFTSERLEMEQKYLRLQKVEKKSEENACIHEHKAQKMTKGYTKVKSENENLYIANKKIWVQIKDTKIGRFFVTQCREGEA